MLFLYTILIFLPLCLANTETHLIKVPHYFDIPMHSESYTNRVLQHLNSTHSVFYDYPIQSIDQLKLDNQIVLQDNTRVSTIKTLLVRINNYADSFYESDDLLSIKLCWPATEAYDFTLSHGFLNDDDLNTNLNIYLRIDYQFTGKPYDISLLGPEYLTFQLYITKLPVSWLPIPAELYQFIIYFVDLTVIVVMIVPYLIGYLFK